MSAKVAPQTAMRPARPASPVAFAREVRRIVLEESHRAHVGHIGSCLSVADIIAALYHAVLRIPEPRERDRDRFILSKGHAALALYAALHLRGWVDEQDLASFCTGATRLGVHPERSLPGVDFSTGSLGHGLSMGAGAALAARLQRSERRTYVLLSDAECDEGSIWEAAMFAAHHGLSNLVAIVDVNGQQAMGYTREVLDLAPLTRRWTAFGWNAVETDGHDVPGLVATLRGLGDGGRPHLVAARTVFGKGVSFMEGLLRWHYMPMTDEEFRKAMAEIGGSDAGDVPAHARRPR